MYDWPYFCMKIICALFLEGTELVSLISEVAEIKIGSQWTSTLSLSKIQQWVSNVWIFCQRCTLLGPRAFAACPLQSLLISLQETLTCLSSVGQNPQVSCSSRLCYILAVIISSCHSVSLSSVSLMSSPKPSHCPTHSISEVLITGTDRWVFPQELLWDELCLSALLLTNLHSPEWVQQGRKREKVL